MDRRLLVLALGMFAMGTDNFVVAGILPSVAQSLGTSVSAAGQMVAVYALTFAVMAPVMAALAGSWPRKPLLIAALALFVAGNAVSALSTGLDMLLASRALAGLGAAMFAPTALGVASSLAAPEHRGRALSVVTAGLAGATALGSPLGTYIAGFGGWRVTLWFVSLLGLAAAVGVWLLLQSVRAPERFGLRERIAPVRDPRVALALLTNVFANGGLLMVYTYAGGVLDRVTGGDERVLAAVLLFWGVAATVGNLVSGRLVDRFGSRVVMNACLLVAALNFCVLPWASVHLAATLASMAVWGLCGWGVIVPQQHRLVQVEPKMAPLLLALNNTATYGGLACSSMLGGLVLLVIDRHFLSLVGAGMLALALVLAELTFLCIARKAGKAGEPAARPQAVARGVGR
jgi:predicted MFS family arabinose efflux permease